MTRIGPIPRERRKVLIFTGRVLPLSETFILSQSQQLQTFVPYYAGARRVAGLKLPDDRTFVVNNGSVIGKAREAAFKCFGKAPQLVRQIKSISPDLVHAHFGGSGTLVLPLMSTLQLPLVVTFHGFDLTMTEEFARGDSVTTRAYLKRRDRLKREGSLFIAVSDFLKEKLLQQGFPPEKVVCLHHGVDTDFFASDPSMPRENVVLFVGRLTEKKGCEYLISAASILQDRIGDIRLVIIGDGELRATLEKQASDNLRSYEFLGQQPPAVVKNWMGRARLLAAPSVTAANGDSEGLPTVIIEALSMGLPVVGTFHSGIPQAVRHGETGLLSEERNWRSLAENIFSLMSHEGKWHQFSGNCRNDMLARFDLKNQTRKLEAYYERTISEFERRRT